MNDPLYCSQCGTPNKSGSFFCKQCGSKIGSEAAVAASDSTSPVDGSVLLWRVDVPLLTNKYVVLDTLCGCGMVTLICAVLFAALFGWSGGWSGVKAGLIFAGGAGAFILLISILMLGLFFGNRCPLEFSLSGQGVLMSNVSERARLVHRLSWILPLLTGRPLMAGPGLIAQSKETVAIRWEDVTSVRRYVDDGVVTVRGGFLDKVRLYCTAANYAEVAARIESEVRKHYSPTAVIA